MNVCFFSPAVLPGMLVVVIYFFDISQSMEDGGGEVVSFSLHFLTAKNIEHFFQTCISHLFLLSTILVH